MLKQHLAFSIALLSSATLYAIPIESRGLSQPSIAANIENSPSPIAGNMNWDLIQKNQQLEIQIRDLRGKMEEQDHQIEQLNNELNNRYTDLDQRLELLMQKLDPETPSNDEQTDTAAAPQSTDNTTVAAKPVAPVISNNTSNSAELEKAAYTIALDAYKKGGAKQAIAPMSNFIKSYPNSIYAGNAYFWLAEFNLAIDPPNYAEAKKNYEVVASKFPDSAKAPRALYQLYSIAKDVNKNAATAKVYKDKLLAIYPKSEEAGFFK